jgi:hypothetical protein
MTEPSRCPCGCGIFINDNWWELHFGDGFECRLCGKAAVSSSLGTVIDRNGDEMFCPLCAYGVAMAQLERHAEMLVEERKRNGS